jgi:hypothetical protein
MMAAALVAGPCGPFFVVPLCGARVFVWFTWRLGRAVPRGSHQRGAGGPQSWRQVPSLLYQSLFPMSDVPRRGLLDGRLVVRARHAMARHGGRAALCTAVGTADSPEPAGALRRAACCRVVLTNRDGRWGLQCRGVLHSAGAGRARYRRPEHLLFRRAVELRIRRRRRAVQLVEDVWPNVKLYGSWLWASESPGVLIALLPLLPPFMRSVDRAVIRICVLDVR